MLRSELSSKLGISIEAVAYNEKYSKFPFNRIDDATGGKIAYNRLEAQSYIDSNPVFKRTNKKFKPKEAEKVNNEYVRLEKSNSVITYKLLISGRYQPIAIQRLYSIRKSRSKRLNPQRNIIRIKAEF